MSCNCGAKYYNKVPCCCSQGSPLVCTTTTCADAQICNQIIESDCVIYTGPDIACAGVTKGMTVTEILNIISIPYRCTAFGGLNPYFRMEKTWLEVVENGGEGYSFTLSSLLLNGHEYATSQILFIDSFTQLVVGTGIDGNTPFIMNINDWLNGITGVATSGFVFHDDMSTIDVPNSKSVYDIKISSFNLSIGIINKYRYFKLSDGTTGFSFIESQTQWPETIPQGDSWSCQTLCTTTTTTVNHTNTGFKIINNSLTAIVTDLIIANPNSGISISLPVNPGQTKSSTHTGFVGIIQFAVNGTSRYRIMIDKDGDGNFIKYNCEYIITGSSYSTDPYYTNALLPYSNINMIIDDITNCT